MRTAKKDSSHIAEKVQLRADNLPRGKRLNVLDAFCGDGVIWRRLQQLRPRRRFTVIGIDTRRELRGFHLVGDNIKFLRSLDLAAFDVIDLGSYGVPYEQLEVLFEARLKPGVVIFVTFCQTGITRGRLPLRLLAELGYPPAMVRKCPSLFCTRPFAKFKDYLALHGVREIRYYESSRHEHHYLCFRLDEK